MTEWPWPLHEALREAASSVEYSLREGGSGKAAAAWLRAYAWAADFAVTDHPDLARALQAVVNSAHPSAGGNRRDLLGALDLARCAAALALSGTADERSDAVAFTLDAAPHAAGTGHPAEFALILTVIAASVQEEIEAYA